MSFCKLQNICIKNTNGLSKSLHEEALFKKVILSNSGH